MLALEMCMHNFQGYYCTYNRTETTEHLRDSYIGRHCIDIALMSNQDASRDKQHRTPANGSYQYQGSPCTRCFGCPRSRISTANGLPADSDGGALNHAA